MENEDCSIYAQLLSLRALWYVRLSALTIHWCPLKDSKSSAVSLINSLKAQMAATAAAKKAGKTASLLETTNFMRQFRDSESRELKQLTAQQFMDVWDHYDEDGMRPRKPLRTPSVSHPNDNKLVS